MFMVRNTVRQDLAKKIGKNFYSPLWHESQQTARKFQYHKTRMSTQFLKDDFPETFPNMDMKTGKGKKSYAKITIHTLCLKVVQHIFKVIMIQELRKKSLISNEQNKKLIALNHIHFDIFSVTCRLKKIQILIVCTCTCICIYYILFISVSVYHKLAESMQLGSISYFLIGGFQLEFVSISWVISHMTSYKLACSHWLKLKHSDWRANLVKD